jgi:hypothetical protein
MIAKVRRRLASALGDPAPAGALVEGMVAIGPARVGVRFPAFEFAIVLALGASLSWVNP